VDSQTLTTGLLVVAVGVIAYLAGQLRAARRLAEEYAQRAEAGGKAASTADASASASTPEPATPAPPSSTGRPAPAPASTPHPPSSDRVGPPTPQRVRAHPQTAPADEAAPPSSRPSTSTAAAPPSSRPSQQAAKVERLDVEEDDEVDPTKVNLAVPPAKPVRVIIQPPLKKIVYDEEAKTDEPPAATEMFLVSATAQTDRGLRRKRNEDSLGVLEDKNVFIVADGMGGYAGGDRASKLAVEAVLGAYKSGTFEGAPHKGVSPEESQLARAIQMANAAIAEEAKDNPELRDMGTTVCCAAFSPNKQRVFIGHVGDSRCYRLRDGLFRQITADHTMAEQGVKGPEGQQLSRAVGIWPTVVIDIIAARPKLGDVYLLCSDGLTKMLRDDIIANVLRNEEDPRAAVERLIFFANSRGGKDNITVVLVRVVPTDWKPKPGEGFPPGASAPPQI
jgi:protein phosphatase